jgi:2-C-methyl-D-erythritol 2,4-cyclodiphosphate synthase
MVRIGNGFDIHRLVTGRKLILGGIHIPFDKGLLGHSDGDVLTHAIIDAILGAAGLKDIGTLFPPDDDQYLGSNSLLLLQQVINDVTNKGYKIGNIDTIIICEQPKLSPHFEKMQNNLAQIMAIDLNKLNIKAKTSEGLGFIGRSEAIASQAVALLE